MNVNGRTLQLGAIELFSTAVAVFPRICRHVAASPPVQSIQLLIVDDDPAICTAYREILQARGYGVATAGSRAEALRQVERLDSTLDVLILDIGLPDADGSQLAHEIVQRIGARPTLYVSGWADEFWNLSDAPGRWLVMQKPIPVLKLIAAIDYLSGRASIIPD